MDDLSNGDNEGDTYTVFLLAEASGCRRLELHHLIDKGITHVYPHLQVHRLVASFLCLLGVAGGSHIPLPVCGKTQSPRSVTVSCLLLPSIRQVGLHVITGR